MYAEIILSPLVASKLSTWRPEFEQEKIDEADKPNIVGCLSIKPFRATVKTREQNELVIQDGIYNYLGKLCHDCGNPSAVKMVDILM